MIYTCTTRRAVRNSREMFSRRHVVTDARIPITL